MMVQRESSREQMFQGASSKEQKFQGPIGTFIPMSELAQEHKG